MYKITILLDSIDSSYCYKAEQIYDSFDGALCAVVQCVSLGISFKFEVVKNG